MTEPRSIIERLRDDHCATSDVDEAADMLEFLFGQFKLRSLHMGGQHHWWFEHLWPWGHARGPDIETAVRNAMAAKQAETATEEVA